MKTPHHRLSVACYAMIVLYSGYLLATLESKKTIDFYQYWVVGQAVENLDVENVYSSYERSRIGKTFYARAKAEKESTRQFESARARKTINQNNTPFLFALFKIYSTGDFDLDYEIFRIGSISAYIGGIVALGYLLGLHPFFNLLSLFFFTRFFWPFDIDLLLGNVTQVQIGIFALYLALQKNRPGLSAKEINIRTFLGGFVIGAHIAFKPHVIYVAALIWIARLISGNFQKMKLEMAGVAASMIVAVVFPYVVFGPTCTWLQWLPVFQSWTLTTRILRNSLPSIMFDVLAVKVNHLCTATLYLITLLTFYQKQKYSVRTQNTFYNDCALTAAGLCIYFLTGPLVHGQYMLYMVPVALFLFRCFWVSPSDAPWTVTTAIAKYIAVFVCLLIVQAHEVPFWHYASEREGHYWNYSMVFVLYVFLLWEIGRKRLPVAV